MPGGRPEEYSSNQDSAYIRELELKLPVASRLNIDLAKTEDQWQVYKKVLEGTPWHAAVQNIESIPPEFFKPEGRDFVSHEMNIRRALYVPGINPHYNSGMQMSVGSVLTFLGLKEDVSPKIRYDLDFAAEVEIVIYSVTATVVATIYKGIQPAGSYKVTWNLRNDEGRRLPAGDYIAEVRIGKNRYVRKRIVIP